MLHQKFIIFDLDQTLINSIGSIKIMFKSIAKDLGTSFTDDIFEESYGIPFDEFCYKLLGRKHSVKEYSRMIAEYRKTKIENTIPLFDGVNELLEDLKSAGKTLGIVTSAGNISAQTAIEKTTPKLKFELFDYFQGADATDFHKPDGRVFEPAIEFGKAKGFELRDIVYIGDAIGDFSAASQAKIEFYAVCTGKASREDFLEAGVKKNRVFESLLEVFEGKR